MSILASHPPTAKPPMTERAEFWRHAKSSSVLFRALKVSLTVGSLLMLINYGDKLLAGTLTLRDVLKIALTYCVPFGVSTWSAARALAATRR